MVVDLVAKETFGRFPRQHLLVGVAKGGVAGGREVVAMEDSGCVERQRGAEPGICMTHLGKKKRIIGRFSRLLNEVSISGS